MKISLYLPVSTNEVTTSFGQFSVDNPILYYDILFYQEIHDQLFSYFPMIDERPTININGRNVETSRYVFVTGEKAFIPHINMLPTFAVQRNNLPALNDKMHCGIMQVKEQKFYLKGNDETKEEDFYYGVVTPIEIKYTVDLWAPSRTDITNFGLFYLNLFSRKNVHVGRTKGLSIKNVPEGYYSELPFYIEPDGSGVTEAVDKIVGGLEEGMHFATANFKMIAFYFRMVDLKEVESFNIHWVFNYDILNNLEVFDFEGKDITDKYKEYWYDIFKNYFLTHNVLKDPKDFEKFLKHRK